MALRVLQFLVGVALLGGGVYVGWLNIDLASAIFPPDPHRAPWPLVGAVATAMLGLVLASGAFASRKASRIQKERQEAVRREAIQAADNLYSQRARAAERDWRSGPLPPEPTASVPDAVPERVQSAVLSTPPPETEFEGLSPAPLAAPAVAAVPEPVVAPPPAPEWAPEPLPFTAPIAAPVVSAPQPVPEPMPETVPEPLSPPVAQAAAAAAPAPEIPPAIGPDTRLSSLPPGAPSFPATATLGRLPRGRDLPAQSLPPHAHLGFAIVPAPSHHDESPAIDMTASDGRSADVHATLARIRVMLAGGDFDEADRLIGEERTRLKSEGDTEGFALAELAGLAGDHAAALGRVGGAKWLWRLSLRRFADIDAIASPEARAVSERLRLADR